MKIEVFTDGSCEVPRKPSGAGWVIVCDSVKVEEGYARFAKGTCNDAEFRAAICGLRAALKYFTPGDAVVLKSDSRIMLGWAEGSYRFKHENEYERYAPLRELMELCRAHTFWVKAHSGNEHNERCDELAHYGRTGHWRAK